MASKPLQFIPHDMVTDDEEAKLILAPTAMSTMSGEMLGEVVVFAIGMRINRLWKIWKWLPILAEMPPMLREQETDPSIGLLSSRQSFGLRNVGVLRHWRRAEDLHAYAHRFGGIPLAAWKRFNDRIGTRGNVGICHETYVVPAGRMEAIIVNIPRYGLGLAGRLFPATPVVPK